MENDSITKMRLSGFNKNKNQKEWYKRVIDFLDHRTTLNSGGDFMSSSTHGNALNDRVRTKRINYNLFNGIIDKVDFEHIYKPLGEEVGELPADFSNKDIISGKIKVLMGMEMERPFAWRVNAVNEEATTRKEQEEFGMYRNYVTQQIMQPIQQEVMMNQQQLEKGAELNNDEKKQLQEKIQQEIQAKTPPEIDLYMKRKHQDPAEILATQLMNYGIKKEDIKAKFNKGWKHACIAAEEIYWVGILNDEPVMEVVNPIYFEYDKETDCDFVEDSEWAGVELWLTPSQVIQYFGDEFKDSEIDDLYEGYNTSPEDIEFTFDNTITNQGKIRVLHRTWRALTKYGFLSYMDKESGEIEERLVDEYYKLNADIGDINIVWEWIPEIFEGYKINKNKYVRLEPVSGQIKSIDNLYSSKLPYVGGIYDSMNSQTTSLIDRMKTYQWYYNVIMYRIEMLMSSDKGKLLLMNINMIPTSQDIDMKQWLYYTEALKIGWMNPNEEGNQGNYDIANAAKEIDMSLISDIQKYIELANHTEMRCGDSIGVTKEMEGRIGQYQAVKTTEQAIRQGSYIVEPYFDFHNIIKRNALTAFLNMSIIAYSTNGKKRLNYILDDFSREMININKELLAISEYGLFVTNSLETLKVKEAINNLSLTAMQNQTINMSDVIKVLRTDNITEAEEKLEVAEDKKRKEAQEADNARMEHEKAMADDIKEFKREEWEHEINLTIVKEEERRETELQKQAILAMGFAEDKDINDNQIPDVLELARHGLDVDIKQRKQNLDEKKFEHQKVVDKDKNKLENKKLAKSTQKT